MGLGFCVGARANPKKVCTLPKGLTVRGPQPVSAPATELLAGGRCVAGNEQADKKFTA